MYRDSFSLNTRREVPGGTRDAILDKLNFRVDKIRDQAVGEHHQFHELKQARVM
jgi:hypothetical protein